MLDQYSIDAGHSFSYRLDELKLGEGKLLTTKHSLPKNQPDLGKKELLVNDQTRVWKGDKQVKLSDLAVGDELLFNITGKTAQSPGRLHRYLGRRRHPQARNRAAAAKARRLRQDARLAWLDRQNRRQQAHGHALQRRLAQLPRRLPGGHSPSAKRSASPSPTKSCAPGTRRPTRRKPRSWKSKRSPWIATAAAACG